MDIQALLGQFAVSQKSADVWEDEAANLSILQKQLSDALKATKDRIKGAHRNANNLYKEEKTQKKEVKKKYRKKAIERRPELDPKNLVADQDLLNEGGGAPAEDGAEEESANQEGTAVEGLDVEGAPAGGGAQEKSSSSKTTSSMSKKAPAKSKKPVKKADEKQQS